MPRYLLVVDYSSEGMAGALRGGGTARRTALEAVLASVGGTLESMHFATEGTVYAIVSAPSDQAMAAAAWRPLAVGAVTNGRIVNLLTPEEVDEITKAPVDYQPPRR